MADRQLVSVESDGDLVNPDKKPAPEKETAKPRARTTSRTSKAAQLDGIKPTMISGWVMVGGGIGMAFPLTGKAIVYQAEEMTDSLVAWGKTSPRIAKILLSAGKTTGAFAFAASVAPVGIALMVELRRINPTLAKTLLPEELHQFIPKPIAETWEGDVNDQDA